MGPCLRFGGQGVCVRPLVLQIFICVFQGVCVRPLFAPASSLHITGRLCSALILDTASVFGGLSVEEIAVRGTVSPLELDVSAPVPVIVPPRNHRELVWSPIISSIIIILLSFYLPSLGINCCIELLNIELCSICMVVKIVSLSVCGYFLSVCVCLCILCCVCYVVLREPLTE